MNRDLVITARWNGEANVWLATSTDVPGLVVEAETWPAMIEEVRLVLPDLLELSGPKDEVAGRDLVAKRLADLRDPERRLLARELQDVLEVDEDPLRGLGA